MIVGGCEHRGVRGRVLSTHMVCSLEVPLLVHVHLITAKRRKYATCHVVVAGSLLLVPMSQYPPIGSASLPTKSLMYGASKTRYMQGVEGAGGTSGWAPHVSWLIMYNLHGVAQLSCSIRCVSSCTEIQHVCIQLYRLGCAWACCDGCHAQCMCMCSECT